MSFCECDVGDYDWSWNKDGDPKPFNLKRRKRCINCNSLINIGDECQELEITKYSDDMETILAPKFLCEKCSDLSQAIDDLNGCYTLGGESLKQQILNAND